MIPRRASRFTVSVVTLVTFVFPFAGCGLVTSGLPVETTGKPCKTDASCDDKNGCTEDRCTVYGVCDSTPLPDGPAPEQTAFDCKTIQCVGGSAIGEDDDRDVDPDDDDCTDDVCTGGRPAHPKKADGASCRLGEASGTCQRGVCSVACGKGKPCEDKNPCTDDVCDGATSICVFTPLNGVLTPGVMQTPGDCRLRVCVSGKDVDSPDDGDLPIHTGECRSTLCNKGTPSTPPHPADTPCGPKKDKVCDGTGSCVACNTTAQCGPDSDCSKRTCHNHVCGTMFLPADTPLPASKQTKGDCRTVVCDGAGNIKKASIVDDTDTPADNNSCTRDICSSGAPSHQNETAGTPCGVGQACDGSGLCGCTTDAQCSVPDTCGGGNPGTPFTCGCTKTTCATQGKTCGVVSDGCYAMLNCDNQKKDGNETDVDCGGSACGTLCAQGKRCTVDGDCATGHCVDGVCCNTACSGACQACSVAKKGGGVDGVCGSIPAGMQDDSPAGACVGVRSCDGIGGCKMQNAQSCSSGAECVSGACADGVCCNTACTSTCYACDLPSKEGVCSKVPLEGTDETGVPACLSPKNACDGAGSCKLSSGQPCKQSAECASGNCKMMMGGRCL